MKTQNPKQLIKIYLKDLQKSGLVAPKSDLELIFSYVLKVNKNKLRFVESINSKQAKAIKKLVKKRKRHIPVQYLIKNVEFMGLNLLVNKNVLIPRNETEQLADLVIKNINLLQAEKREIKVLDMCCGSGAIGLSIAKHTKSFVNLADISKRALRVAKKNARLNMLENVGFIKSDLFDNISFKYDFFVSNPPYVKSSDMQNLEKQVKCFEPSIALDGGESGLEFYKKIILSLPQFLNPDAVIFFEVGIGQADEVASQLESAGFNQIEIFNDYYGVKRIVKAKF